MNFRSLFLVLGAVILIIVSVGCGRSAGDDLNNDETIRGSDEQQQTNMTTENHEIVSFQAETYIQAPALSWEYSLDVKIEDGKIYINDTLYEESSSAPPVIVYSEGFLAFAAYADKINNTEITNTLTKIQNSESCYLLETDQDSTAGKIISVYEIDDFLYFVRFFDNGEVMRIHCAPVA